MVHNYGSELTRAPRTSDSPPDILAIAFDMDNFWQNCLPNFHRRFGDEVFRAFVHPLELRSADPEKIVLAAPNTAVRAWAEKNLPPEIAKMENPPGAVVVVDGQSAINGAEPPPPRAEAAKSPKSAARPKRRGVCDKTGLRTDLVFANFIPGPANMLSLAAAKTLTGEGGDDPDFNQLFIYGGTGLGKTHLMHAIGNQFLAAHPEASVRYAQARDFMSDVVSAFRNDREAKLREKYHSLDMLLVDDIQYIGGDRQRTQEEFFYLFNLLQDRRGFVAVACDRPPAKIDGLPPRLTSRLASSMATQLSPPDLELRVEILRQKAAERGAALDDAVARFIASHVKSNVRELEGAFKRAAAHAKFVGKPVTVEVCRDALADILAQSKSPVSAEQIQRKVAEFYGARPSDMTSKRRNQSAVRPRQAAIYLCRKLTNMSLPEIGRIFGGRNHTTVLHACREIERRANGSADFADELNILEMSVKS